MLNDLKFAIIVVLSVITIIVVIAAAQIIFNDTYIVKTSSWSCLEWKNETINTTDTKFVKVGNKTQVKIYDAGFEVLKSPIYFSDFERKTFILDVPFKHTPYFDVIINTTSFSFSGISNYCVEGYKLRDCFDAFHVNYGVLHGNESIFFSKTPDNSQSPDSRTTYLQIMNGQREMSLTNLTAFTFEEIWENVNVQIENNTCIRESLNCREETVPCVPNYQASTCKSDCSHLAIISEIRKTDFNLTSCFINCGEDIVCFMKDDGTLEYGWEEDKIKNTKTVCEKERDD